MSNALKRTALALLLVLAGSSAFAQNVVGGSVTDAANVPLEGVAVFVKGTSEGTITNSKGHFSINAAENQTLVFSCLGYQEVEETVGKRTVVNVKMSEESTQLEAGEIVSTGYGTTTRRDLTGSISKADMGTIMKSNVTSFDSALSGRVAGVVVTTSDGALGTEASITIRGNNSLTQSNQPLFIIDGFPSESSFASSLNSADIESMDILKDASATAIYGARGANGVIVITTKSGQEGKPKVNFSSSWTMSRIANKADLMNPYEFVRLQSELLSESTMADTFFGYSEDYGRNLTLDDYRTIKGIDWQDKLYRSALQQSYNLSVSGGTKGGATYNIGGSVLDQDGIIINSNFQRYQGKANITIPFNKKISFNLNANYSRTITNGLTPTTAETTSTASGWLIFSIWGYRPVTSPGQDIIDSTLDEGIDHSNDYRFNPVKTARNEYRKTFVDLLNANASLTWKLTNDLTLRLSGGYKVYQRRREEFNGSQTYTGYPGSPSGKGVNGTAYWTDQRTWVTSNTLQYKKRFGRSHNFDALIGMDIQGQHQKYDGVSATQISSEELGIAGIYTGNYQVVPSSWYDWTLMSFLMRTNYNYKYRYYFTFSFRGDGSSRFPDGNRWGWFPSAGISWNFNREEWMKNISWLSNGKLRASWGLTGNNRTSSPYDYYSQITVTPGSPNSMDYVFDGSYVQGYYVNNMANKRLKWETTEQWNIGLDLGLFDGRIKFTGDWYSKETRDLLLYSLLPSSSGFVQGMLNIGKMQNKGIELSLETVNIKTRNFSWSTSFNIAFNRNKIVELIDHQNTIQSSVSWDTRYNSQFPYISQVGKPTGLMYGYMYEGTYKYEDFDLVNGEYLLKADVPYLTSYTRASIRPGDPKYKDMNHDGVLDDYDRTIIGSGQPAHTGGFGNNFTWKNWDLNIFFTWSYGNDILNANRLIFEAGLNQQTNQLRSFSRRWSTDRPESNIPRAKANGAYLYSSRVVEDGSFLRLKNVSLGYTFSQRVLRKSRISSLRLHVSLDNILTITGYSGPDPEVSTRQSVLTPGFDWSAYPRAFGLTGGLEITF